MSRWQAAAIHLGISAAIALVVLAVIYLVWYPSPYFTAMGGDRLVLLVAGVDVVLGPLITLIIFRAGKPGLRFDLGIIAFLQATALAYGVSVVAQGRPVYLVYVVNRFQVVSAADLDQSEIDRVTRPEYKRLSWLGPVTVGVRKPTDVAELNRIVFALGEGKDLQHFPQHYVPYAEVAAEAGGKAQRLDVLRRINPRDAGQIDAFLTRNKLRDDDAGFIPMRARRADVAVIVRRNGEIAGMLELDPWGY